MDGLRAVERTSEIGCLKRMDGGLIFLNRIMVVGSDVV
jgi:hypothetical protein